MMILRQPLPKCQYLLVPNHCIIRAAQVLSDMIGQGDGDDGQNGAAGAVGHHQGCVCPSFQ